MHSHKIARIRQLCGGVYAEEPTPPRIVLQPRYRVDTITKHDKAVANSFLKREASAARGSQPLLRRVKSKLSRPDRTVTLTALCNHVDNDGAVEVAQIYIDRLALDGAQSGLLFDLPDRLLVSAIRNANVNLVRLLAPFTAEEAVTAALESAVNGGDHHIVTALLEYGADPNRLNHACFFRLLETDLQLLQIILRAPRQLRHEPFGNLCIAAIRHGYALALNVLLRSILGYRIFHDGPVPWNRDSFLGAALASSNMSSFFSIAASTFSWPLRDYRLCFQVVETLGVDRCLRKDMLEVLLCLSDSVSPGFQASPEIQSTLCHCIQNNQEDMLRLLLSYDVRLTADPLMLVCHNQDWKMLNLLLAGQIRGGDQVAARVSQLSSAAQPDMRQKILNRLLADGAHGVWKHSELVKAASAGHARWVDELIDANASVDYYDGSALLEAVAIGHVPIVQRLLSRPVAASSLQAAFPTVSQLEPLPRRLLTKLFISRGLTGQCLDDALNGELCNYSYHRDHELIDVLISAGGHCNHVSLTVIFEHGDTALLDQIRASRTLLDESASQWFRSWHRVLFNHVRTDDGHAVVSLACLKLLLSKSGVLEDLCHAHDSNRPFECFHQFLEDGAKDVELLSACLKWGQHMDPLTFTELVLTAAYYCDSSRLHSVVRSRHVGSLPPSPSSNSGQELALGLQSSHRVNQFSSAQIPTLRGDFSDARDAEALKVLFRQYLHDTHEAHLATRLLKRQLQQCAKSIAQGEEWPLLALQYLLSQPIDVTLPEYTYCLQMAIASDQWLVLESLLDRQLPREMLSSFFLVETSSLTPPALRVLLDSQAVSCMEDEFFFNTVQRAFNHACLAQDQQLAVLLCTRSRQRLHIRDVLGALQQAIDVSEVEYIGTLLSSTTSSTSDLEVLWNHISQQYMGTKYFALLEMLLKAGVDGGSVAASLIDAIEKNDERVVNVMLAHWQGVRAPQHREDFDYQERQPIWKLLNQVPATEYFSVLAHGLSVAVRLDRAHVCKLLCNAGAPLVYQRQSLIELAVIIGSHSTLMELLRHAKRGPPEMQQAVDFTLLQVVMHNRPTWIHSIVNMGGSVEAYDLESLKAAARLDEPDTLTILLTYSQTLNGLYAVYEVLEDRLKDPGADLSCLCAMFEQIFNAGFDHEESYSKALLAVSKLRYATLEHVNVLVKSGASVEYRDGECLLKVWRQGNVTLLPHLLAYCSQQAIVTKMFNDACKDYLREDDDDYSLLTSRALLVFQALLETDIPQQSLDTALDEIARTFHHDPSSSVIIKLLLEKGAQFIEGAGLPLYQVCRLGDPDIISLVAKSNPPIRTRLSALHPLFLNQRWTDPDQNDHFDHPFDVGDHACLYNINFSVPEADATTLEASDIVSLLGAMLNPRGHNVGTGLMFSFFFMRGGLRLLAPHVCSDDDRNEVEQLLVAAITNSDGSATDARIEFLLRVMQIDALNGEGVWSDSTGFALKDDALNRLLLLSSRRKKSCLIDTLLEAGADPSATDEDGRSALYLATLENSLDTMETLIANGAKENDGSLHIATCWQHHEAMHLLIEAGHSFDHPSELFLNETPLETFLGLGYPRETAEQLTVTLAVLLCNADLAPDFWTRIPNPLALTLNGSSAYEMFSALLAFLPTKVVELPLLPRDRFVFSILSLVERGDDVALTDRQRIKLSTQLEELGFTRTYYAIEGDQPEDAINVPEELEAPDVKARRRAFREKDCVVCSDKPDSRHDIHAALSPICEANHGWDDDIICTDCLRGHLESQMFPQSDDRFPSAKVKCWAPNCPEILSHSVLQMHAKQNRFAVYDASLAQLYINDGANTAKCANPGCIGATWLDEEEDRDITIITCPVCDEDTCIQCNQLYDKHRDEPCPVGEEARGAERRQQEEAATAALMANGKKCPKCQLPFERIEGCDHIVCGKDAHSQARSRGCGFEFCYGCGADYNAIRRQGNTAHVRGCSHYA
ncbi:hypothetical protein H2200_009868 [Cladophialophora chaetospira]|uniref:RING-type domain-containing protein n=1 Tax=Cladophialophora chaetospira TaxID=386627 RepID=A0AA39CF91_9EURO|nr:hypothetical protein H2200_009868 [Cladophialophora chaetospira]